MTNDIWIIITAISSAISAIGMIAITYFVYKWSTTNTKKETYFRHMVEIYFKIEDDSRVLALYHSGDKATHDLYQYEQSIWSITVNCTLMIYYLQRIPGYYEDRLNFFALLYKTSNHPLEFDNYSKITEMFKRFCWELRDKKNSAYTFNLNYDGRPIKQ